VWDTLVLATDNPDDNPHTAAFTGPAYFSKTTDGGKTWSAPQVIVNTAQNQQTIGNVVVVDSTNGTLYDFFDWILPPNSFGNTGKSDNFNVAFVKSSDGGSTWTAPQQVARIMTVFVSDPNTGAAIRTGDIIPEVAINSSTGALYAVWQDSRFNGKNGNFGTYDEVAFSTSTDGGVTWSTPIRASTPKGSPAFTPTVRSNSNGTLAVTYYDFRNLPAGDTTTLPTDYWVTFSTDGGKTFGNEAHLKGSFDMLTAPNARGFFVGDYEGLASTGTAFRPLFVAANSGNISNRTDVFTDGVTP
jgi:Neuraminidase (sialidase)